MDINAPWEEIRGFVAWEPLLRGYEWPKGVRIKKAWERRCDLETQVKRWIAGGFQRGQGWTVANAIHQWGFGLILPEQKENWEQHYHDALSLMQEDRMAYAAEHLIRHSPRLGIVGVSKLLSFADQTRFAIYDSRVGFALRTVTVTINGDIYRAFPCPPWRGRGVGDNVISRRPEVAAEGFAGFVRWARRAAICLGTHECLGQEMGWTPAFIEMALFMAGQNRNQRILQEIHVRRFDRDPGGWFPQ